MSTGQNGGLEQLAALPITQGSGQRKIYGQRAPESIRAGRKRSSIVEIRSIIAYSLIALFVALAIVGLVAISKERAKSRKRGYRKGLF